MSLKKTLQKQNYDLIEGPIRNQDILQLWIKPDKDKISIYSNSISKVFDSPIKAESFENPALTIDSSEKEEFDFNTGIGFIKNALQQFKIADAKIDKEIKEGKSISVSYNNSYTKEIERFDVEKYLSTVDTLKLVPSFLKELNKDNLIVITGVVFAKNLQIAIDSNQTIDSGVETTLNKIGEGKVKFNKTAENQMTLTADAEKEFPIAVKAYRIRFKRDKFKKLELVTDNRNFFK